MLSREGNRHFWCYMYEGIGPIRGVEHRHLSECAIQMFNLRSYYVPFVHLNCSPFDSPYCTWMYSIVTCTKRTRIISLLARIHSRKLIYVHTLVDIVDPLLACSNNWYTYVLHKHQEKYLTSAKKIRFTRSRKYVKKTVVLNCGTFIASYI